MEKDNKFIIGDNRIYLEDDDGKIIAEVEFPEVEEGVCTITRTFVDSSLRGQGIADKITREAYDTIKAKNKKIRPDCSYAVTWFERNPEKRDIKVEE